MKNLGERLGLTTNIDDKGNVIIKKPATAGMENRATVVLQSCFDVGTPKKTPTRISILAHNTSKCISTGGELVKARGAHHTLGTDNNIGMEIIIGHPTAQRSHPPVDMSPLNHKLKSKHWRG